MNEQPTHADLLDLNRRLSDQLISMSDRLQATLKGQMAKAWDEGFDAGERDAMDPNVDTHTCIPNPYRKMI